MISKRTFLSSLLASSLFARPATPQSTQLVQCIDTLRIDAESFVISSLPSSVVSNETTAKLQDGYGHVQVQIDYVVARFDGHDVGKRSLFVNLRQPNGQRRTQVTLATPAVSCPTNSCDPDEAIQVRYKLDRQHFARVRTTQTDEEAKDWTERGFVLSAELERALRDGVTLWIEVATRDGWERGEISARRIDQLLKRSEKFHRDRLRAAYATGKTCRVGKGSVAPIIPCYMTTMLAHMLHRDSDSFEVRMLNRLQPRFAKYQQHLKSYVRDSQRIAKHRGSWVMSVALMIFYGVFIWPAAVLISLRAFLIAGLWYFGGFQLLKLVALVLAKAPKSTR